MFYNILVHAHSGLRWVVLALLIAAVFKALLKWRSNAPFTEGDRKLNLFTMISAHVQLVLGLVLYFMSPKVKFAGEAMGNSLQRLYLLEHPIMMLIAIVLITIGYSRAKKLADENKKFKQVFIYFGIALLLILSRIPWPFLDPAAKWF